MKCWNARLDSQSFGRLPTGLETRVERENFWARKTVRKFGQNFLVFLALFIVGFRHLKLFFGKREARSRSSDFKVNNILARNWVASCKKKSSKSCQNGGKTRASGWGMKPGISFIANRGRRNVTWGRQKDTFRALFQVGAIRGLLWLFNLHQLLKLTFRLFHLENWAKANWF